MPIYSFFFNEFFYHYLITYDEIKKSQFVHNQENPANINNNN